MSDKEPEISLLGDNIYRFIGKVHEHDGIVDYDFKFKVFETPSLSAAVESIASQIIRKRLNLKPHHKIKILSEESKQ